jgi:hypothetical protein
LEKIFVAQQVAKKLISTEGSLDAAITEATEFMTQMLQSQRDLNLSPVATEATMAKMMETLAALGQARSAIVGCHNELNELRLRLGLRTRMAGFQDKPPEVRPVENNLREAG